MIIHIWMHWFWITTACIMGFQVQSISLSSISLSQEAGLLANATLAPITPGTQVGNHSSQLGNEPNVTETKSSISSPETTPHQSPSSPQEETITEETTTTATTTTSTSKPEDVPRSAYGSTSDAEDIYAGGTLDVFQYPLKKFTKYSHLKYGKAKTKGKPGEETEERKIESLKVVEEKVNINISITGRPGPEVDNDGGENTSEVMTSDDPDPITTTTTTFDVENVTSVEPANATFENVSPRRDETSNGTSPPPSTSVESSTKTEEVVPAPTEKEEEVLKNETLVIENKVEESGTFTTVEPFVVKNRVAAATSAQNYEIEQPEMNAGSITGITLGILVVFSLFGAVSFVFYRRRYLNKPQVLHDKCSNLDSSGYIDETSLKENSEEMYSLDNDSFLNSLEAMTIQNYWTENVKHTKL